MLKSSSKKFHYVPDAALPQNCETSHRRLIDGLSSKLWTLEHFQKVGIKSPNKERLKKNPPNLPRASKSQ